MTDWSKVGRKSKNKGKNYERLVAKNLTEFTGVNFRKTPASGGFNKQGVTVAGHIFCGDLMCDSKDFLFSVEAKNRKEFSFPAILKNPGTAPFTSWWFQTVRDAKDHGLEPMLWFKPKSGSPDNLVVLRDGFVGMPNGMAMRMYEDADMKFTIKEKGPNETKMRVHNVVARLPMPVIYHWNYIKEEWNKDWFFGTPDVKDYGTLISYD